MMKKILLILCFLSIGSIARGQDTQEDIIADIQLLKMRLGGLENLVFEIAGKVQALEKAQTLGKPQTSGEDPVTGIKTVIACEGEKIQFQCDQYEIIEIVDVFWGRDDHATCSNVPAGLTKDKLCETNSENALQKVKAQCENEQACEFAASNIFFDDNNDNSCGNVYKYVRVKYKCNPEG